MMEHSDKVGWLSLLTEAYWRIQDADDESFEAALADLGDAIEIKADNIAVMLRLLDTEDDAAKVAMRRRQRRGEALTAYLMTTLEQAGTERVQGQLFTVSIEANPPSLNVLDREAIPYLYRVLPPQPPQPAWRPDAKAIIDALKKGETVPGAEIVVGKHLRIR